MSGMRTSQPTDRVRIETDCEFMLRILSDGQPHNLNELLQRSFADRGCGLTPHSRAANLRDQGYSVVNFRTGPRGAGSWYQLLESTSAGEGPVDVDSSGGNQNLPDRDDGLLPVSAAPIPGQLSLYEAAA